MVRCFGNKVFFGDVVCKDLLVVVGVKEVKLLIIVVDELDKILVIIKIV